MHFVIHHLQVRPKAADSIRVCHQPLAGLGMAVGGAGGARAAPRPQTPCRRLGSEAQTFR